MAHGNATITTTADASDVTYSSSSAKDNTGNSGLIELSYAFLNATIKNGDDETGMNTPALRAENIDMYLDKAQFLKVHERTERNGRR